VERARRSLRFVLAHDVSTVIPGLRSVEEVEYAVKVAEEFKGLTAEERRFYRLGESPPEPFCRECGLCSCPEGIHIPAVLRWDEYHTFYGIRNWTKEQYDKLSVKVGGVHRVRRMREEVPVQSADREDAERRRSKTCVTNRSARTFSHSPLRNILSLQKLV